MAAMRGVFARVSVAELQQWPDDGRRYELSDGEVSVVPVPVPRHQRVVLHIQDVLGEYERTAGGLMLPAPIDIVLSEYDVVQPDIVFVQKDRQHLVDLMQAPRVAPDLVVEVLSRSTEARDRHAKSDLFARFGVPEYWIADPMANSVEVYANAAGRYALAGVYREGDTLRSRALPGLVVDVRRLFTR